MNIEVFQASQDEEFEAVYNIRRKVFIEEQQVPEIEEYDGYEPISHHYLALFEGKPAGCARWRITPWQSIKLERFAVLLPYRKKGIGAAVLNKILHDLPASYPIYLHAQESAIGFYEKNNFRKEGERFFECEIPHFKMTWIKPEQFSESTVPIESNGH
jgi:predicted GNAT family N-acyltransferase